MMQLFGITWASSEYIGLVSAIGLFACGVILWRYKKVHTALRALAGTRLSFLIKNYAAWRPLLKIMLRALGVLCLLAALLRPQWGDKEEVLDQEGRDLFIALDVSRSMLAQDVQPNRLEFAKEKIKKLLKLLEAERVGLILFSGATFVQCPLTTDYPAFLTFLQQVDNQTISSGTTALDQAILKALSVFKRTSEAKDKLLIIFTDGEDYSSNLASVKRKVQKANMHIFTIGVGTPEGAPIPIIDQLGNQTGHEKNPDGSVVLSKLNEGILAGLSRDSGGTYIHITQDNEDIKNLARQVEVFEKEKLKKTTLAAKEDQFQWFVAAGFVSFIVDWLV